jgi:ABC-type dipeptide/oligopeptide/nickel transport system permease subunit
MASIALSRGLSGGRVDTALTAFAPNNFQALPGIPLAIAVQGFSFFGDALTGRLDPRTRLELGI